jgi:hypothetical protein
MCLFKFNLYRYTAAKLKMEITSKPTVLDEVGLCKLKSS